MKKTYAETQRKKPFDWNEALKQDWSSLSKKERNILRNKAENWVTCACGNQCSIIPRYGGAEPIDNKLKELGVTFSEEIFDGNLEAARKILTSIEKRSAILIKKEVQKKAIVLKKLQEELNDYKEYL